VASFAIQTYFGNLKDPRRAPRHRLLDIIGIAIQPASIQPVCILAGCSAIGEERVLAP